MAKEPAGRMVICVPSKNFKPTRITVKSWIARKIVDLVAKLLRLDPYERLSAADCLNHPFVSLDLVVGSSCS